MLTAGWPADMLTESARAKTPPEHFFTLCAPLYTEHVWQNITVLQYDNMVIMVIAKIKPRKYCTATDY